MESIVELSNVSKEYPLGKLTVSALKEVSLSIAPGEFTVVAGPSGSGKTTLLNLVGCMDVPTTGEVTVDGQPIARLDDNALTNLRLFKLGFIFQSFNLISVLNVFQNIEFPLLLQGGLTRGERESRVRAMIDEVGLAGEAVRRPNELSGGQRQRVAIARALVIKPRIVLADEPTGNLDSATGLAVIDLMKKMNEHGAATFIFSTHDPKVIQQAKREIRLVDGRISEDRRGAAAGAAH
jgi:putative ABC transport system ATP-binding protein